MRMKMLKSLRVTGSCVLALVWLLAGAGASLAAETNPPPAAGVETPAITPEQAMRAYLHVQEQLRLTQRALEDSRAEATAAAKASAESMTERIRLIEQNLAAQRLHDLEAMERSNKTALIVVGAVAMSALLLLLLSAWLQSRSMQKFAEATNGLRLSRPLAGPSLPLVLGPGGDPAQQASAQVQDVLQRLQRRIEELEHTATVALPAPGEAAAPAEAPAVGRAGPKSAAGPAEPTGAVFLRRGIDLLSQNRVEEALASFSEGLVREPGNTDLLLKRGAALERLQRLEEAIASYDAAIAANPTLTTAYLLKGAVLNRLKRQPEALQCYELALSHQRKGEAA